jgi:hypothetical protein
LSVIRKGSVDPEAMKLARVKGATELEWKYYGDLFLFFGYFRTLDL